MKKIPILLTISIVILAIAAIGIGLFTAGYIKHDNLYQDYLSRKTTIDEIEPAEPTTDYSYDKKLQEAPAVEGKELDTEDALYTYKHGNILFVSYSKAWDDAMLRALCDELYKNKHGDEIELVEMVTVYGEEDEELIGSFDNKENTLELPVHMQGVLPEDFNMQMDYNTGIFELYDGDNRTTIEQMAVLLSNQYGYHFTQYYFNLNGYDEDIENDEYFKLRYTDGMKYTDNDWDNFNWDNAMWYITRIAARDYTYLMGSPTAKRIIQYYDSHDTLSMDVKGQDDELDAYYAISSEDSFNREPHNNIAITLPDRVDGLAELFYSKIGEDAPAFEYRDDKANTIDIQISRRTKYDMIYYKITWNKPWTEEDVVYTLVQYDQDDNVIGAIKSINGKEEAIAYIGSVIVETSRYYYYWTDDYWVSNGDVRFRIVVTFPDGTAVISPYLDRSF